MHAGHSSRVTAAVEAEKVGTAGGSYKNEAEAAIVIRYLSQSTFNWEFTPACV